MNDLQFESMVCSDKHIVNLDLLNLKDRNIKEVVFDCYDNLKSTILVAWNDRLADMEDLFKSDFKKELAKSKEYEFSADVNALDNVYSKFQLKYIIDPEHVSDKYRRVALENTIRRFEEEVKNYDNVRWDILDYLKAELFKEEALFQKALVVYNNESKGVKTEPEPGAKKKRGRKKNLSSVVIKQLSLKEEDMSTDLFVQEQSILVPEIDRNNKYRIDGINYYGVFNNIYTGLLTKSRTLGYKIFKDGKFNAAYFGVTEDPEFGPILYVGIYGFTYNPFHILTREHMENVLPNDLLVFNNTKNREDWEEIINNTYLKALHMDQNEEDYMLDLENKKEKGIHNKKVMHLPDLRYRAMKKERRYKIDINIGCRMILEKLEEVSMGSDDTKRYRFTHLNSLEEVILRHINEENKIPKTISPTKGAKRINLNPGLIVSIIKKNSDEHSDGVLLFRDNKKEPNPFDVFHIFAYSQTSNHISTQSNKHVSSKAKRTGESTNWIKWGTLPYLSIYFSKNNVPLGKNNILHFDIGNEHIVERSKLKEVFKDIYEAKTL